MRRPADKFLTANGWADDRLMQAYDLIWEVQEASKALGINNDFIAILAMIETVSGVMAEVSAEQEEENRAEAKAEARAEQELGA